MITLTVVVCFVYVVYVVKQKQKLEPQTHEGITVVMELINQNKFFQAMESLIPDLEENATDSQWMILIPDECSITTMTNVSSSFLKSHIVVPSKYFKEDKITLNGKAVRFKDGAIHTVASNSAHGAAFKEERTVKILSEIPIYTASGKSFPVIVIERPLVGNFDSPRLPDGDEEIFDYKRPAVKWIELLRKDYPLAPKILELDLKSDDFNRKYMFVPNATGFKESVLWVVQSVDDVCDTINFEEDELQSKSMFSLGNTCSQFVRVFRSACECLVQSMIFQKVFNAIVISCKSRQHLLIQQIHHLKRSQGLTLKSLDIREDINIRNIDDLKYPSEIFNQLNEHLCVRGKLQLLHETIDSIYNIVQSAPAFTGSIRDFNGGVDEMKHTKTKANNNNSHTSIDENLPVVKVLSSDDLLPLLIMLICISPPSNILANMKYLEHFGGKYTYNDPSPPDIYADILGGGTDLSYISKLQFAFTSFNAALTYILQYDSDYSNKRTDKYILDNFRKSSTSDSNFNPSVLLNRSQSLYELRHRGGTNLHNISSISRRSTNSLLGIGYWRKSTNNTKEFNISVANEALSSSRNITLDNNNYINNNNTDNVDPIVSTATTADATNDVQTLTNKDISEKPNLHLNINSKHVVGSLSTTDTSGFSGNFNVFNDSDSDGEEQGEFLSSLGRHHSSGGIINSKEIKPLKNKE